MKTTQSLPHDSYLDGYNDGRESMREEVFKVIDAFSGLAKSDAVSFALRALKDEIDG